MRYSYSSISTFSNCPYQWFLRYKEKLKTIPETNPDNALYLGLGVHKGLEMGSVEAGLAEYKSHYNIIGNENINWMMQLEYQIPRALEILPPGGEHEIEIKTDDFIGYVDYVVGDTMYDFKFSNNVGNYLNSPQLSIYKYYLEQVRPDLKINHLKYLFIPKVNIRQKFKSNETLREFRERLKRELENTEIRVEEVEYNQRSVAQFQSACQTLNGIKQFPKNKTRLCDWCQYQRYCESGGVEDWMIM